MKYFALLLSLILIGPSTHAQSTKFDPNVTAGDIMRLVENDEVVRVALKRMKKKAPANGYKCSNLSLKSFKSYNFQSDRYAYSRVLFTAGAMCSPKETLDVDGDPFMPSIEVSGNIYVSQDGQLSLLLDTIKFGDE